jgi:hypothetical protein
MITENNITQNWIKSSKYNALNFKTKRIKCFSIYLIVSLILLLAPLLLNQQIILLEIVITEIPNHMPPKPPKSETS